MLPLRAALLLTLLPLAAARHQGPGRIQPPPLLSGTGLYRNRAMGEVAPGNLPFAPQYPLWSDGAGKARWVHLPGAIGARDAQAWDFPVGTKFWKEFAFGGRKVETRLLWRAAPGRWVFASYRWRADQSDADLVPPEGLADVADLGEGRTHSIPSVADCNACHGNGASPVLGFTALQLSTDRDPQAPHAEPLAPGMVTLATLETRHLLSPSHPELLASPPRIQASTPRERAALGYLATNCGTCHTGPHAIKGIDLAFAHASHGPEPALAAVDRPSHFPIPGQPRGATRIIQAGDPDHSALLFRMAARRPESRMPPMGTVVPDEEALTLLRAWIREDLHPR